MRHAEFERKTKGESEVDKKFTEAMELYIQLYPNDPDIPELLFRQGKLYYDLLKAREDQRRDDVALVRLEQYYPLPHRRLAEAIARYPNAADIRWVQEEPANQGAWPFLGLALPEKVPALASGLRRVSRRPMSAPASGSSKVHEVEQREIITTAFE